MHFALASLTNFLDKTTQPSLLVTGACIGGDALFVRAATILRRKYQLDTHALLPDNRSLVDKDFEIFYDTWEEPGNYRVRDRRLVQISNMVLAVAVNEEDHPSSQRSGTWMTIRMARNAGVPVHVYIANKGTWI